MRDLTKLGYTKDTPKKAARFKLIKGAGATHSSAASSESLEGPILDQNDTGSCTGHGTSQWMEVTYAFFKKPLPFRPSPKGIYALTRAYDRLASVGPGQPLPAFTDSGGMPADIVVAVAALGIRALVMPSPLGFQSDVDTSNVTQEEKLGDLESDYAELLGAAQKIDPTDSSFQANLAAAIEKNGAAAVGIFVDTGFENYSPASGPIQTINQNDPNGGGHWLAVTSFRTATAADEQHGIKAGELIFRGPNSWTPQWGDAGHWEMSGACLVTTCSDAYTLALTPA